MATGQLSFNNCPLAFTSTIGNYIYLVVNPNLETTPTGVTSPWYAICLNTNTIIGSAYTDPVLARNACQTNYNASAG